LVNIMDTIRNMMVRRLIESLCLNPMLGIAGSTMDVR